jgi:hypothetical protein
VEVRFFIKEINTAQKNVLMRQKEKTQENLKITEEFDFYLVEKHGWYSPTNKKNNLSGVSRDHILSVKDGFDNGIPPHIISHPANCRLMIHTENISKNCSSDITYEELLEKIKKWDEKYGRLVKLVITGDLHSPVQGSSP